MISLVRTRVQPRPVVPASRHKIAGQLSAEGYGLPNVCLTAWTRDEAVGAELSRASVSVAANSATWAQTGDSRETDEHLFADAEEVEPAWLWAADVIVRMRDAAGDGTVERQLLGIFRSFPGCLIAGIVGPGDLCVVGSRDGWSTKVVGRPARGASRELLGWYVSLAHGWVTSGRSLPVLADAVVTVSIQPVTGPVTAFGVQDSCGQVISVIRPNL